VRVPEQGPGAVRRSRPLELHHAGGERLGSNIIMSLAVQNS
jgi:hypothetical protein